MQPKATSSGSVGAPRSTFDRRLISLSLLVAVFLAVGGSFYYHYQYEVARKSAQESLAAIADLKAQILDNWIKERRGDLEVMRNSLMARSILMNSSDANARDLASSRFKVWLDVYGYSAIFLADAKGEIQLKLLPGRSFPDSEIARHIKAGLQAKDTVTVDLNGSQAEHLPYLWLMGQVFNQLQTNGPPDGIYLAVVDLRDFLYPVLRKWPTSSRSGETLLVQRSDDNIIFLNEVRHATNATVEPRVGARQTLAAKIFNDKNELTKEEALDAVDYRGASVLAVVRAVPNTPWVVVAKMDSDEIFAPLHREAYQLGAITFLLLTTIVFGLSLLWRQHKLAYAQTSEARLRTLIEQAPLAINISRDGKSIYSNQKFLDFYGYQSLEEIAGKSVYSFWAPEYRDIIKERVRKRVLSESVEPEYEGMAQRRDGSQFPVQIAVAAVELPDGRASMAFINDITERRRAEMDLQASEERYRGLVNSMQDIFYTVSADGNILFIGPQVQRYGFTVEELTGKPFVEFIFPEDRVASAKRFRRTIQTGDDELATFRVRTKEGKMVWIEEVGHATRDAMGKVISISGMLRDVTENRRLEEQFRQAQKMDAIGQLAGGVAHDFNNILAAMMMQTELLAMDTSLPGEAQEGLQQIRVATERAASLTRQLLLFGRKQVMQVRDVDLNEMVTSLVKMLQRLIGAEIRLQLNLHSTPLIARADVGMLDQVLLNLVVNARDAMPNGGRLLIETGEKNVDEEMARLYPDAKPGRYVSISVSDTGTGIPPEVLPRIFEPFFTTKDPGKGTGLGLATVFGIAKQHRGWIRVYSEVGQGTNFQIFIPASDVSPAVLVGEAQSQPRGGTETILLAEDDAALRMLMRSILERHGYRVLEAANGIEALKVWTVHQEQVALLLTDMVMPGGMSGQRLARQLQAIQPKVKVIYMSGYSAEIAGRELELRTGENFLQKPCPPEQLLNALRRTLDGASLATVDLGGPTRR